MRLLNYLQTTNKVNWQDIVFNFGFYDQSHFIKSFEQVAGITPECFMKNKADNILITNSLLIFPNTLKMKPFLQDICNSIDDSLIQFESAGSN
jgi:AraC-like DNA-binding protein